MAVFSVSSTSSRRFSSRELAAVRVLQGVAQAWQHAVQHVGHPQCLTCGRTQRDHGNLDRGQVQVEWAGGIGRVDAGGQQAAQQAGVGGQQGEEDQRQAQVEAGVEVGDDAGIVGVHGYQPRSYDRQQRQGCDDADAAVDQVADRQAAGGGIVAGAAFQHRIDRGAEVGAEHQGEGGVRGDDALGGERHRQQHHRDAGVRRPGQAGGQDDVQHRLG